MPQQIVVDNTIASQVINALRDDIVTRRIDSGSRITIKEIAARYGVSAMPVREAFRTLEGERLLQINAHKGATVLRIDESFAREVYGMLRVLENLIYETALPHVDDALFTRLEEINTQIKALTPGEIGRGTYVEYNHRFHGAIMEYGRNSRALEQYDYYHMVVSAVRRNYVHNMSRVAAAAKEHDELIRALRSGDVYQLKAAVDKHSENSMNDFIKQYAQE